jgi:hypothetical protein
MATYYVLGMEIFNTGEVMGIHANRKTAQEQADTLEKNKNKLCCQNYRVKTKTEVKNEKINLY